MKSAYTKTKDKAEQGYYAEENSPTEYAADKVSHASGRIKDEGIHQFNKQGQKNAERVFAGGEGNELIPIFSGHARIIQGKLLALPDIIIKFFFIFRIDKIIRLT